MATFRKRNGRWQVQVRRKGQPSVSRTFTRKTEALAWAHSTEVLADKGELGSCKSKSADLTFLDLLERYKQEVTSTKAWPKNEEHFIATVQRLPFARKKLGEITRQDFASYRDSSLQHLSGSSVKRNLSVLQHVFSVASKEWGIEIEENPVAAIRKPKSNPSRERRLRDGEYGALLASATVCKSNEVKQIIMLAVETAMRRSEIFRIEKGHISSDHKFLHIPKTKTGSPRTIPLSELSISILRSCEIAPEEPLFSMSINAFRLAWERTKERAGIDDLHFHDLRHEAISRLFEKGLGVAQVAAISGHKDFRMLARYTHLNPELSALDKL